MLTIRNNLNKCVYSSNICLQHRYVQLLSNKFPSIDRSLANDLKQKYAYKQLESNVQFQQTICLKKTIWMHVNMEIISTDSKGVK